MTAPARPASARSYALASGTLWTFLAEALVLPTGIITAAVLTRALKPELYGVLSLMGAVIAWLEWTVTGFFSRATTKLIAETHDWQPVCTRVLQLSLAAGVAIMLLLWVVSPLLAWLFKAPEMASYLRLYAVEVPLVVFSQTMIVVLTGLGRFNPRAAASALRWVLRMGLVVLFILLGWSLRGAILANIAAAALEMLVLLAVLRPRLLARSSFPVSTLLAYGIPLTIFAVCLQLYQKIDLLLLQAIGGNTRQSGYYGVAQNLAVIPHIVALSFVPLLISTLSNLLSSENEPRAQAQARAAIRFGLWLLPLGALVAASAAEIIGLLFGSEFLPGAPLLALLMLAGFVQLIFTTATGILTAAGQLRATALLAIGMLAAAVTGHLLVIPRFGAAGAAWVTLLSVLAAVLATFFALKCSTGLIIPIPTLLRALVVCALVAAAGLLWPAPDWWVALKLAGLLLLAAGSFCALGEFSPDELTRARQFILKAGGLRGR